MDDFFENLNKLSKDVQLQAEAKAKIRNQLVSFMNLNPAKEPVKQGFNFFAYIKLHRFIALPAVAALLVVLGTGTSFAAQGSMPGDLLYPVKVHVNEEVKSALITDPDAKADFEITRVETRLVEADDLAIAGKLNAQAQAQVETNFDLHAKKVQARIQKLIEAGDTEKAAELASRFEASLQAHTNVLAAIQEEPESSNFKKNVDGKTEVATKQRQDLNAKIASDANQEKVKGAAQAKISVADQTIARVKAEALGSSTALDQLKVAEGLLVEAKARFQVNKYKDSFELAAKAERQALQAKALIKVETRLPQNVQQQLPNLFERERNEDREDGEDSGGHDGRRSDDRIELPLQKITF